MTKSHHHHHHPDGSAKTEIQAGGEQEAAPQAPESGCNCEAGIAALTDKLLRAVAENDNLQKRAMKDREDMAKFAISMFAKSLLSVADNLRRALSAASESVRSQNEPLKHLAIGVEATERELLAAFEKAGITRIEPINVPFDPHQHEVMFDVEMPGVAPGTIIQLIEPGYLIHGRLLRPARVAVARGSAGADKGNNVNTSA